MLKKLFISLFAIFFSVSVYSNNLMPIPSTGDVIESIPQDGSKEIKMTLITSKGFVSFKVGSDWPIIATQSKPPIAVIGFQLPNKHDINTSDSTNLAISFYNLSEKTDSIGKKYGESDVRMESHGGWTIYTQETYQYKTLYTCIDAKKHVADVIVSVRLAWPHLKNNEANYDTIMKTTFNAFLNSIEGGMGTYQRENGDVIQGPG